ncbi:MAG: alanine racemase [Deltaproteobacteria bacterium]|nr:alanine racemase [Deltaproteobacteria bacterium]
MIKRPTTAFIYRDAIRYNYLQLKKHLADNVHILAVVKADAYGHGAVDVSKTLEKAGCRHFGVAILEEAALLREAGISSEIIILGGIYEGQESDIIRYNLTPVVFDENTIVSLNNTAAEREQKVNIHVKVDTGMGRLGILPQDVVPFFRKLKGLKNIAVEGILTHLAEIDENKMGFSEEQIGSFLKIINIIKEFGFEPLYRHIANSAAIVNLPSAHFNLVRPGIMLYGAYPVKKLEKKIPLKSVMELKTRIVQLKRLPKGCPVSYGRTFIAERESAIAVIPIGYGDGYPRHLSNKGEMLVRGTRARVAGVVCMDLTMLDVTDINDVQEGDEVTVIGRDGKEEILVEELSEKAGTIPYEIMCNIGKRVPRVYIN